MGLFEELNEAGLLSIGLTPQWVDLTLAAVTGAPDAASDGVFLENSPTTLVFVALREEVHRRTCRVVVTVADVASTHTNTIGGNAVATTGRATPALTVIDMVADIIADGPAFAVAQPSVDPDDATGATLLLTGKAEADYAIDSTVAGGTGAVTISADALSCNLRLLHTRGGIVKSGSAALANRWVEPNGGAFSSLDYRGFSERFDTAGWDRLYPEIDTVAGHGGDGSVTLNLASISIGPAVLEAST